MAHLHCSHSTVVEGSRKEFHWNYRATKDYSISSSKTPFFINVQRGRLQKNSGLGFVHCCSSSASTSDESNRIYENKKLHFGYLVSDVNWQVRRMAETEDEMKKVANVQGEAFHEPVFLFDDLFFEFFKAEVLSGLLYKLKNSPPERYACLVAEPMNDPQESQKELAGVVDVTVLRDDSVLQHLPGAQEYLYVSGIAVLNKFRRQKVATLLLKACDILSTIWGYEYLVLRAYEDDHGARKLYSNAGYRVVSGDPPWLSTWIGKRRKLLMVKGGSYRY